MKEAVQTALDFGENYPFPFTEQHIYALELPFEVSKRMACETARFYNLFKTGSEGDFYNAIHKAEWVWRNHLHYKNTSTRLSAMGIIAEHAKRYDFALALYNQSYSTGYRKHLEWKMSGSDNVEDLLLSVEGVEADQVSKIFRKKGDIETSDRFILKAANDLHAVGSFLFSARLFSFVGRFDDALTDLQKYATEFETNDCLTHACESDYKNAEEVLKIARIARKKGYTAHEKMYDAAITIYSKLKNRYMIGRIYTELGKKREALEVYRKGKCFFNAAILEKNLDGEVSVSTARKMIAKSLEQRICDVRVGDGDVDSRDTSAWIVDKNTVRYAKRFAQQEYLYDLLLKRFMISSAYNYASSENMDSQKVFLDGILKNHDDFQKLMESDFIWRSYIFSDASLFTRNAMDDYAKLNAKDPLLAQKYVEKCVALENGSQSVDIFTPGLIEVPKEFEYYFVLKRIFGNGNECVHWNTSEHTFEFYYLIGNVGINAVNKLFDFGHYFFLSDILPSGRTYSEYENTPGIWRSGLEDKEKKVVADEISRHEQIKEIREKSIQKSKRKWRELGIKDRINDY